MKKIELLAPAGSLDCVKGAINGGADAVYFGTPVFNARMNAKGFTPDELDNAFRLCKLYGVKTNVTLNTLIYNRELDEALKVVSQLEEKYSPDAYIVQDLGLAYSLKKEFPSIVLHASTQCGIHNAYGLEPFKKLGFSRVVIAREVSKKEIEAFKNCGMETEIFVHGAMCVCQSGGCLMSSFIGGRSGNRGECAYPCRLPYKGRNNFPLSLKDMCLGSDMTEVLGLGVSSLKIEGRMKSADYVYEVTSFYRKLIDEHRNAYADEISRQEKVFSRSGFTNGYFTSKISPKMFGVRSEEDKQQTRQVVITQIEKKLPVSINASFVTGEKSVARFECFGISVKKEGEAVSEAQKQPLGAKDASDRLSKLGNTCFYPENVTVNVSENAFMTVSGQNSLRREGIELLENAIIAARKREKGAPMTAELGSLPDVKNGLVIRMGMRPNIRHIENSARYEIPLEDVEAWEPLAEKYSDKLCLVIPRTVYDSRAEVVKKLLEKAKALGITKVCCENLEHLALAEGFDAYGGMGLNVTNEMSAKLLYGFGFKGITLSPEASPRLAAQTGGAYTVYGKLPIMHTRACIITNICGCKNQKNPKHCDAVLVDRTGTEFLIKGGFGHTNNIYNSVPIWLFDKNVYADGHVLYFTNEDEKTENQVLDCYFGNKKPVGKFTRGKC